MRKVTINGTVFTIRELFLDCTVKSFGVQMTKKEYYTDYCTIDGVKMIRYKDGHYYIQYFCNNYTSKWKRINTSDAVMILENYSSRNYSLGY